MVQQFGKRIIGGIGAPGGGMSKAYAEGVNTGINQRMNRQSMAAVEQDMQLAAQDQAFKIEDREEAKRRRAAAEAAAGAARARSAALARALAGTVGKAPGVTIPPQQNFGPRVSVGGPISATPPAARTPVAPSPPLSFKLGATGQQISEAPLEISNIEFVRGTRDPAAGAPAFERGGRGGIRVRYPEIPPEVDPAYFARMMGESRPLNEILQERVLTPAESRAEIERMRVAAETPAVVPAAPPVPTDPAAVRGPAPAFERGGRGAPQQNVTIMGPAGPLVIPIDEAYPTGTETDGESIGRPQMSLGVSDSLSFGPALGAPSADINASIVDRVAANPPGQPMSPPNTELFTMEPGRSGRELQQAYNEREELVRQIGIYSEYGEYGEVAKLVEQVKTIDNNLYLLQGMQGIQELEFNSPQRLQMVLSEQLGRNIGIQANDIGGYDLFVDGQLAMQLEAGNGENSLAYWARTRIDSTFAEAEAARAAAFNEEAMKSRFTQENDRARILEQAAVDENRALLTAQLDEDKQVLLAELAIAQDYGTKENEVKIDLLRQRLIADGSLLPDADIDVRAGDGVFTITDKNTGDLVQFILQDVADETGNVVGQKYVRVKE